ncbi:hypothetical protein [Paenibacillus cremeus]|uniref:hypothetical protein n=1 Tax=Paenibacillus cremeus TaxID=2163881 RepID=UPI0021BD1C88|nr:hypothetical protein [Paenibacillus cremeus]
MRTVGGLVVLAVLLAAGLVWYVKPVQPLDLAYTELPLRDKLASMLVTRKLEITLTEAEVNQLLKKALAAHAQVRPDVTITGAKFAQQGDRLVADVNLLVGGQLEAGARLNFDLAWQEPNLIAVHTGTVIKQAAIPPAWFQLAPLQVNVNNYLPQLVAVKGFTFEPSGVKLSFKLR